MVIGVLVGLIKSGLLLVEIWAGADLPGIKSQARTACIAGVAVVGEDCGLAVGVGISADADWQAGRASMHDARMRPKNLLRITLHSFWSAAFPGFYLFKP